MDPHFKGLRAYANWLLSNYEIMVGASQIKARPLKLTFDATNVCQLRCPLCPTGLQMQYRDIGHAHLHMFQHLIEEVGDYVFFLDFFSWGEPLLNPRIEEFIRLARAKKIVSIMSTNLSLPLTDERIDRLVTSGLNHLIVSLDGASADTYATYRRKGKFDLVISNIRRISAAKRRLGQTFPVITWQFLVFRFNEHEIDKATAMAADIGADRITFRAPYLDEGRFELSAADKQAIASWTPQSPLYQIALLNEALAAKSKSRCGWHYMSAAINWDGTVASCDTTFEKRDDFGTIGKNGEHSYMGVVNNPTYRAVRDRFAGRRKEPVDSVCEHCPTPTIMDYHRFINRQVILFTIGSLLAAVSRLFRGWGGGGQRPWRRSSKFPKPSAAADYPS